MRRKDWASTTPAPSAWPGSCREKRPTGPACSPATSSSVTTTKPSPRSCPCATSDSLSARQPQTPTSKWRSFAAVNAALSPPTLVNDLSSCPTSDSKLTTETTENTEDKEG